MTDTCAAAYNSAHSVSPGNVHDSEKLQLRSSRDRHLRRAGHHSLFRADTRFQTAMDLGRPSRLRWHPRRRSPAPVSYTHLRAHETDSYLVCRLLLEKKKKTP